MNMSEKYKNFTYPDSTQSKKSTIFVVFDIFLRIFKIKIETQGSVVASGSSSVFSYRTVPVRLTK